jgi:hypothetical protein
MQRAPTRPSAALPVIAPRPATLTDEEETRAAELEAAIVAAEQAAETTRRTRSQRATSDVVPRAVSSLAVAASNEYAYVARDVRRIAVVGGTLVAVLAGLWVIVRITGVSL